MELDRLKGGEICKAVWAEETPDSSAENRSDSITVTGEKPVLIVVSSDDKDKIERKVYLDSFLYAPIKQGDNVGRIEYSLNGKMIEENKIVAVDSINSKKENKNIFTMIKDLFTYG